MKKKILFVYPEMMIGGSTTNLIALMRLLDRSQYEIYLQLYKNQGPLMNMIPKDVVLLPEVSLVRTKRKKHLRLLFSHFFPKAMFYRMPGEWPMSHQILADFDISLMSGPCPGHFDYALGGLEGWADRYVAFCVEAEHKFGWIHSVFDKIAPHSELELPWMEKMDKIFSVTERCNQRLKECVPTMAHKAEYLENIADSGLVRERAKEIPEDELYVRLKQLDCFRIITVCRIDIHVKGLDRIVKCASELRKQQLAFCWVIIGDGPDMEALRNMIRKEELSDYIWIAGKRTNPYPYIAVCDVMCMPSRWEGKPFAVTESMMLGVPPVVTEYLSVREQIQNGVDGIIVPNEDNSISTVLPEMVQNSASLKTMRQYLLLHEYGNSGSIHAFENAYLDDGMQ